MSPLIQAALETMDLQWPGYGNAKTVIRSHVEALESTLMAAHWYLSEDNDVDAAAAILAGTVVVPLAPKKKAIKGKKPCRKS